MARHSITRMAATSTSPRRGAPPPPVPAERSGVELSTGASTLGEMILRGRDRDGVALRYKESGRWNEVSYARFVSSARSIARGLMALGLEPGDRVSILADTRPDWTLADAGSFCAGAVVAPIYQTSSPEECEYVLRHSEARAVFCEDAGQVAKVEQVRERCPALEHVIAFQESGPSSISMERLIDLGAEVPARQVEERVAAISPDSVATLVYTSGTTGPPKACMLTHLNWIAEARGLE
jgi:long-chain acyl-CoA synthetase